MSSYRPADTGENTFLSTIISQTSSGHLRGFLSREHIADVNLNDTSVYMEINCWSTKQICIKIHVPSLSCPSTGISAPLR